MTALAAETSPLARASLAGFLYLLANLYAPFTLLYSPSRFVVRGDAAATASNVMASESLFRLGIVGNLLNSIAGIFLVLALHQLLKVVNKNLASPMVVLSLAAVPIVMLNELAQLAVLRLLGGAGDLAVFTPDQLRALALLLLHLHNQGLNIAQMFWGLWLFPMGHWVFQSGFLPRILGVLLIVAGFGYLIQSLAVILLPSFRVNLIFVTGWGELLLFRWLLIRGVNAERWEKRATESARSSALG